MFKTLKNKISELAYSAVNVAEQTLTSATGAEKKQVAIEYLVSMLPIIQPFKSVAVVVLSAFIDEAIEKAVTYMNSVKNKEA